MGIVSTKLRNSAKGQPCAFQIPGYPKYSVDRAGNVYGPRGCIKRRFDQKGYLRVQIYDETGRCRNALVHRLVAITFIPNPLGFPQVNHLDEDKANPRIENLEWCDASTNIRHSRAVSGKIVDPSGRVLPFSCIEDLCNENGLTQGNTAGVLSGKIPHHKGWRRATPETIGRPFTKRVRATTPFVICKITGETIRGTNISQVAAENDLCRTGLSRLISGKIQTHRGWSLWAS